MQVAVGVDRAALGAAGAELGRGLVARRQVLQAELAVGHERDPLDVVLREHGVGHLAHGDHEVVAVTRDDGHVLLGGGVGGAGGEQLHRLAAAAGRDLPVLDDGDDVSAVVAAIELDLGHVGSSPPEPRPLRGGLHY